MNKERRRFVLISPTVVANNFLARGKKENIEITPLKLQKLVYFLYADYIKTTNKQLFTERFETWTLGPVVPSIYTEFSSYGGEPIKTFAKDSQGKCYMVSEIGDFKKCIDKVWTNLKYLSGKELSEITHREGTAWSKAKEKRRNYLEDEDIRNEPNYFT